MYILDTNIISELRKKNPYRGLINWVRAHDPEMFYLSVVTIFEIERGVRQVERKDELQGRRLRAWLDQSVLTEFQHRILPIDTAIAQRAARLHIPDPRPERDCLIAATVHERRCVLVTRNVKDFFPMSVELINPWNNDAASVQN